MATLKDIPSNGETGANISTLNNYIADGHGNEVLARTNRYIDDGHGLTTTLRGYNCPADPTLATELMQDLLGQYENNLAGRQTKGTTGTKSPVTHEHLILSFHKEDDISPELGHEIVAELIRRTKLSQFPILAADHNNTDEFHLHLSTGVVDVTGQRKLCLNQRLRNDIRRELDYICAEHGLSIVENPELFADPKYQEWFQWVKAEGKITIHPPLTTEEKRERREERMAKPKEKVIPPMTEKNRGTHFYCLPHLFDPAADHSDIKQPLYIYAMDDNEERRAPMHLAFDLERWWCYQCIEQISKQTSKQDVPGKQKLIQRLHDTMTAARDNYDLLTKLDICTTADLRRHMKCVGKDLSETRKYIEELDHDISAATDTEKLEARKAKAKEREAALRTEYRQLSKLQKMYEQLMDPAQWDEYKENILTRAASRLSIEEQYDETVRLHYHDIGQLLGIAPQKIDQMIEEAKTYPQDMILSRWVENRGKVTVTYTQTAAGVSAIYQSISDMYEQRSELRSAVNQVIYGQREAGLLGLLFLPLTLAVIFIGVKQEVEIEKQIAETRQLVEEIRWHNKNSMKQLQKAKSRCALLVAYGDAAAAAAAWDEFAAVCSEILQRETHLGFREQFVPPPRPDPDIPLEDQVPYHFQTAIRDFKTQIKEAQADIKRQIAKKNWDVEHAPKLWDKKGLDDQPNMDPQSKPGQGRVDTSDVTEQTNKPLTLADKIQNAQRRSDEQKKTVQRQQGKEEERG